ncbi:hypothetical protein ACFYXQ_15935 [Nocardia jiangxiensis]|uniref:Uncharacterized protein n=1 Tax=Nocardia jiangxiensis TaxID=282685 RepID=A0ABW6RZ10_9NOCA
MTDPPARTRPRTTAIETLRKIRCVLDAIACDLETLCQIEEIQQQHHVVLTSSAAVTAHLHAAIETLQQTLACDGRDITARRPPNR